VLVNKSQTILKRSKLVKHGFRSYRNIIDRRPFVESVDLFRLKNSASDLCSGISICELQVEYEYMDKILPGAFLRLLLLAVARVHTGLAPSLLGSSDVVVSLQAFLSQVGDREMLGSCLASWCVSYFV
jgi:hypothetical protein